MGVIKKTALLALGLAFFSCSPKGSISPSKPAHAVISQINPTDQANSASQSKITGYSLSDTSSFKVGGDLVFRVALSAQISGLSSNITSLLLSDSTKSIDNYAIKLNFSMGKAFRQAGCTVSDFNSNSLSCAYTITKYDSGGAVVVSSVEIDGGASGTIFFEITDSLKNKIPTLMVTVNKQELSANSQSTNLGTNDTIENTTKVDANNDGITNKANELAISIIASAKYTIGDNVLITPTLSGNPKTISISPPLPDGLSINPLTGLISGVAKVALVSTNYTLTATNTAGDAQTANISISIFASPSISIVTPVYYTTGDIVSLTPTIGQGTTSVSINPALRNGLSFNTQTGVISGTTTGNLTPTSYTLTATNDAGATQTTTVSIGIFTSPTISVTSSAKYTTGDAVTIAPTLGSSTASVSISPALSNGLSLNTATGVISGTAIGTLPATSYTLTATNAAGATQTTNFSIGIFTSPTISVASSAKYTTGDAVTITPTVGGGATSVSISPALSNGLSLNTATGVVSGTATGTLPLTSYTLTATNAANATQTASVSIGIFASPTISVTSPAKYTTGDAVTITPTVGGGTTSVSISPALGNGLSLNATTGAISGTATGTLTTTSYTLTAANDAGTTQAASVSIAIFASPTISVASSAYYTTGDVVSLIPTVGGGATSISISPALGNGLNFDTATGAISGTATGTLASTNYTLTVTNNAGATQSTSVSIGIFASPTISIASSAYYTTGDTVSLTPTVGGGTASVSISPALGNGLSLNATTGAISGTATGTLTTTSYTLTAANDAGTTQAASVSIAIFASPTISVASSAYYTTGDVVSLIPTVGGGTTSISISPALGNGLSFDTATGAISGTATGTLTSTSYTLTATNDAGVTQSTSVNIGIFASPTISIASSAYYTTGDTVSLTPTVGGGTTSVSINPALGNGLSFNTATGVISGTTTGTIASTSYTLTAANDAGTTQSASVSIAIFASPTISVASSAYYTTGDVVSLIPTVGGGTTSISISPALGNGLSFDTATGAISGTATGTLTSTSYTLTATNGAGVTQSTSVSIGIFASPTISIASSAYYTTGDTVSLTPTVGGGTTSVSINPALGNGLSFNTATGVISGTTTGTLASTNYTLTATNDAGTTQTANIDLGIFASPTISVISPAKYTTGDAVAITPTVGGGATSVSISPALANGLSLNTTTGVISGTATGTLASTSYTLTAANDAGTTQSASVSIAIFASPTISIASSAYYTTGDVVSLAPTVGGGTTSISISPALANGLNLNATTGVISGTTTGTLASTNYTLTATNDAGTTQSASLSIAIFASPTISVASSAFYTTGDIVSLTPTVGGGTASVSINPALGNGLSLDPATGVISGTTAGTLASTSYTLTATNGAGATQTANINIGIFASPTISVISPAKYTTGDAVAISPTIGGGTTSVSISPALANGLSLNTTTGVISGTATGTLASTSYTLTAANDAGTTQSASISIAIFASPTISVASSAFYTTGDIVSLTPTVGGGTASVSINPPLGNGLSLDPATGVISGTTAGTLASTSYTLTATNDAGATQSASVSIAIFASPTISIASSAFYTTGDVVSLAPTVGGGTTSVSINPALGNGLSLNIATGVISGTTTGNLASTNYTLTAANDAGATQTANINIGIFASPTISVISPAKYTTGDAVALTPTVGGGTTSVSINPALANGLSLNTTTGVISGTATGTLASTSYTLTAANNAGATQSASVSIAIFASPTISIASSAYYTTGDVVSLAPTVGGGTTSVSISPALANGLSLNTTTGVISGTATGTLSATSYTLTATNNAGATQSASVSLAVFAAPTISVVSPAYYTTGDPVSLTPTVGGGTTSVSISPALTNSLSLNTTTGVISGTATGTLTATNYTLTATNNAGATQTANVSIGIFASPTISISSPVKYTTGDTVSLIPTVGGGTTSVSISPALANGLSLNTTTGTISGTATGTLAATNYTLTAANNAGATQSASVSLAIFASPTISIASSAYYTTGDSVSLTPTVGGGATSVSINPALTNGLSFNTTTGAISGTATGTLAATSYTLTATNNAGATQEASVSIGIFASPTISISSPVKYTTGDTVSLAPTIGGGTSTVSIAPALGNSLSLNTTTGVISGTATGTLSATSYTLTAQNQAGASQTASINISIFAIPTISVAPTAYYTTGDTASVTPTIGGGTISVSISPALSNGLSLNTTTGVISGTATGTLSATNYTLTATNSAGATQTAGISIGVFASPTISVAASASYQMGASVSITPTINAAVSSVTISPALGNGLILNTTTGAITGTAIGTVNTTAYTLTAHNPASATASAVTSLTLTFGSATTFAWQVEPTSTLAGATMPSFKVAVADAYGNTVTSSSASIQISYSSTPSSSATLSGTTATASSGVATFSSTIAGGFAGEVTFSASSSGLASANSSTFTVLGKLDLKGPSTVYRSNCATYTVTILDTNNAIIQPIADESISLNFQGSTTSDFANTSNTCSPSAYTSLEQILTFSANTSSKTFYLAEGAVNESDTIEIDGPHFSNTATQAFTIASYSAPGAIDTIFATNGYFSSSSYQGVFNGVIVSPVGKIYAATFKSATSFIFAFTELGEIDTTFNGTGMSATIFDSDWTLGDHIIMQPDGKFITNSSTWSGYNTEIARYNSNGTLDTTFKPSTGWAKVSNSCVPLGSAWQNDSKILLALGCASSTQIMRFNSNGTTDTGFSVSVSDTGQNYYGRMSSRIMIALQPDQKILLATGSIYRFNSDGSADTSFGSGTGSVSVSNPVRQLRLQPDGKILTLGSGTNIPITKYNQDGSLDSSFGTNGVVSSGLSTQGSYNANDIVTLPDGRILISGYKSSVTKYVVACYSASGILDTSFASSGFFVPTPANFGSYYNGQMESMYLQPDGKLVGVGATTAGEVSILRIWTGYSY